MELITYNFSKAVTLNYIMVLFYIVYIKTSIKKLDNYDPYMVLLLYYIGFYISRGFVLKNIMDFSQRTLKSNPILYNDSFRTRVEIKDT